MRESLTALLGALLTNSKPAFVPAVMKAIVGAWWLASSDPVAEVAAAARAAFLSAVPPKKRPAALAFLAPSVFEFVGGVLEGTYASDSLYKVRFSTWFDVAAGSDRSWSQGCVEEEAMDRRQRATLAGYRALCSLLGDGAEDGSCRLAPGGVDVLMLGNAQHTEMLYHGLWERAAAEPVASLRAGLYDIIATLAIQQPDLTRSCVLCAPEDRAPGGVDTRACHWGPPAARSRALLVKLLRGEIHRSPGDAQCCAHALQAYTHVMRLCPELLSTDSTASVSVMLRKVLSSLKDCFQTHRRLLGEFLLPIVGTFPASLVAPTAPLSGDAPADAEESLGDVCALAASGLPLHRVYHLLQPPPRAEGEGATEELALDTALVETITYLVLVRDKSVSTVDAVSAKIAAGRIDWLGGLLTQGVGRILRACLLPPKRQGTAREAEAYRKQCYTSLNTLSKLFAQFERLIPQSNHSVVNWNDVLWSRVAQEVEEVLVHMSTAEGQSDTPLALSAGGGEWCIDHGGASRVMHGLINIFTSAVAQCADLIEPLGVQFAMAQLQEAALQCFTRDQAAAQTQQCLTGLMWAEWLLTVEAKREQLLSSQPSQMVDIGYALSRSQLLRDFFEALAVRVPEVECRLHAVLSRLSSSLAKHQADSALRVGVVLREVLSIALSVGNTAAIIMALEFSLTQSMHANLCSSAPEYSRSIQDMVTQLMKIAERCVEASTSPQSQDDRCLAVQQIALILQYTAPMELPLVPSLCHVMKTGDAQCQSLCVESLALYFSSLLKCGDEAKAELATFVEELNHLASESIETEEYSGVEYLLSSLFTEVVSLSEQVDNEQYSCSSSSTCMGLNPVSSIHCCWHAVMTRPTDHAFVRRVRPVVARSVYARVRRLLWSINAKESLSLAAVLQASSEMEDMGSSSGDDKALSCLRSVGLISPSQEGENASIDSLKDMVRVLETALSSDHANEAIDVLKSYVAATEALCNAMQVTDSALIAPSSCCEAAVLAECVPHVCSVIAMLSGRNYVSVDVVAAQNNAIKSSCTLLKTLTQGKYVRGSEIVKAVLEQYSPFSDQKYSVVSTIVTEALMPSSLGASDASSYEANNCTVFLNTPVPGDANRKDVAMYLQILTAEDIDNVEGLSASRPRVGLVPARVAAIHSDGPPDAPYYYTLALLGPDGETTKEIQTEPHRILLRQPRLADTPALLDLSISPLKDCGIFQQNVDISASEECDTETIKAVCAAAVRSVQHMISLSTGGKGAQNEQENILKPGAVLLIPPSKLKEVQAHGDYVAGLLRSIGELCDTISTCPLGNYATTLLGFVRCVCRGVCIQFLSSSTSLRALSSVPVGLRLLSALMSSRWGSGYVSAGGNRLDCLWLAFIQPAMWALLHSLNTASRLVFSAEEKTDLLNGIFVCLSGILVTDGIQAGDKKREVRIDWRFLRQYVLKKVLQQALPTVSASSHQLNFLECMVAVWSSERSDPSVVAERKSSEAAAVALRLASDVTSAPQWEIDALRIGLEVFLATVGSSEIAFQSSVRSAELAMTVLDMWVRWYGSLSNVAGLHCMLKATGLFQATSVSDQLWFAVTARIPAAFSICAAKLLYIWYSEPDFLFFTQESTGSSQFSSLADIMDFADHSFFSDEAARRRVVSEKDWNSWQSVQGSVASTAVSHVLPDDDPELSEFLHLERNDACRDGVILAQLIVPVEYSSLLVQNNVSGVLRHQVSSDAVQEDSGYSDADESDSDECDWDSGLHFYLKWVLILRKLDALGKKGGNSEIGNHKFDLKKYSEEMASRVRDSCFSALGARASNVMPVLLHYLLRHQPRSGKQGASAILANRMESAFLELPLSGELYDVVSNLNMYCLYSAACVAPSLVRSYYDDGCNRGEKAKLKSFIERFVSGALRAKEIEAVTAATAAGRWNECDKSSDEESGELSVTGSRVSGEVTAVYSRDDASVEMHIKLPAGYPLRNVEVECTGRLATADGRWRRWVLQIVTLLTQKDGSIVDAVMLWRKNVDNEFEGVEPCPICYSTLHPKKLCLPTLQCATCKNKFHPSCLYTWFQSSGKSKCVICQQNFVFTSSSRK